MTETLAGSPSRVPNLRRSSNPNAPSRIRRDETKARAHFFCCSIRERKGQDRGRLNSLIEEKGDSSHKRPRLSSARTCLYQKWPLLGVCSFLLAQVEVQQSHCRAIYLCTVGDDRNQERSGELMKYHPFKCADPCCNLPCVKTVSHIPLL